MKNRASLLFTILLGVCMVASVATSTTLNSVLFMSNEGQVLRGVVKGLNTANNSGFGHTYDIILADARSKTSNGTLLLSDMTNSEINLVFWNSLGDAELVGQTKDTIECLEQTTIKMRELIGNLPTITN